MDRQNIPGKVICLALFGWLSWQAIPYQYTDMMLFVWLLWGVTVWLGIGLCMALVRLIPTFIRHIRVYKPKGEKGTARWGTKADAQKAGLLKRRRWWCRSNNYLAGMAFGAAFWLTIESSGLVLSPAGGGKTVCFVIPALMHNGESMVVTDLKGTLSTITKRHREKLLGHKVYCINPAGLYTDILGAPARYNPLKILIDDWQTPERHKFLCSDSQNIALQLISEPPQSGENAFFRNGSRKLLSFAFLHLVILNNDVTLGAALSLLSTMSDLEAALYLETASEALKGDLARLANDILGKVADGERRQFESFREGALQALEPFAQSGILAESTSASDFSFADLKREKITVYIMADPTQQDVCKAWIGLVAWAAKTELIRFQNGNGVTFMLDEVTNFKIEGLPSLLTTAREFKIRLWLVVQELEQWAHVYGREALETLLSQTETKIIHGSRSFKTCKLISDMLGEKSIRTTSYSTGQNIFDPVSRQVSEAPRKLLTPDEVARFEKIILLKDQLPPFALEKVGYHQVTPWRSRAGINPLFGKPFKGKVKLRL